LVEPLDIAIRLRPVKFVVSGKFLPIGEICQATTNTSRNILPICIAAGQMCPVPKQIYSAIL
jgi:hypothetical protein